MKTILSGVLLLGLGGCGELSSTGNTGESSSQKTGTQGKKSIVGRKTREILNANEAIKDQNFVIVELKMQGSDPFTQSFSAYEKLAPFVGTIPIQQWIKRVKIVDEHTPSYAELQKWMKDNPSFTLPVLPYQRMYGYDETNGKMVVLEKRDEQ